MSDAALLSIIRAADAADAEDLMLRVALAVVLRGTDELIFGRQLDRENRARLSVV